MKQREIPLVRMRTMSVARIMTAYFERAHGYEQESTMTLYILNVIFTFKLTVKGLNFGPNLHSQVDVI